MDKATARRKEIIQMLKEAPIATVIDMAGAFSVSTETIRKDLLVLEKKSKIVRIHGGAALLDDAMATVPYQFRERINTEGKAAIAAAAVKLIEPNDSILLESSTTTAALCLELLKKPDLLQTLDVVTNSLYFAQLLQMGKLCSRLLLLGGWSRSSENATYGHFTSQMIRELHVNKSFISAAALGQKLVLSAFFEDDVHFQRSAIEQAEEAVLLLDKSKYPQSAVFAVTDISNVQYIVTDATISEADEKNLKKQNVRVIHTR